MMLEIEFTPDNANEFLYVSDVLNLIRYINDGWEENHLDLYLKVFNNAILYFNNEGKFICILVAIVNKFFQNFWKFILIEYSKYSCRDFVTLLIYL